MSPAPLDTTPHASTCECPPTILVEILAIMLMVSGALNIVLAVLNLYGRRQQIKENIRKELPSSESPKKRAQPKYKKCHEEFYPKQQEIATKREPEILDYEGHEEGCLGRWKQRFNHTRKKSHAIEAERMPLLADKSV